MHVVLSLTNLDEAGIHEQLFIRLDFQGIRELFSLCLHTAIFKKVVVKVQDVSPMPVWRWLYSITNLNPNPNPNHSPNPIPLTPTKRQENRCHRNVPSPRFPIPKKRHPRENCCFYLIKNGPINNEAYKHRFMVLQLNSSLLVKVQSSPRQRCNYHARLSDNHIFQSASYMPPLLFTFLCCSICNVHHMQVSFYLQCINTHHFVIRGNDLFREEGNICKTFRVCDYDELTISQ